MIHSNKATDLIKKFEGCRLTAYLCPAGVWTIGYGHTGDDVYEGLVVTQEWADEQLRYDIMRCVRVIETSVKVALNQNQIDALASFIFNVGAGAFKRSTLLKKLNQKDIQGAADEFLRWNKVGNRAVKGLTRRRISERELFLRA